MFLFINIICEGIQFINWAKIISNNLCDQLLKLRKNYNYYMTSLSLLRHCQNEEMARVES